MKKLSLQKLKLQSSDLLKKEELKSVLGGYGGCCSVWYKCNNGSSGFSDCSTISEVTNYAHSTCDNDYHGGVDYIGGAGC